MKKLTCPGDDFKFKSGMTREEMDEYYRENEPMLHALLKGYIMPKGEADYNDMLQCAALGFFKGMATFDPKVGVKMSTYCYQCADNEVKQYFRRAGSKSRKATVIPLDMERPGEEDKGAFLLDILDVPEGGINPHVVTPDEHASTSEIASVIKELWNTILTDTERKVLNLVAIEQMTQNEAAAELGISQANVSKSLNYARSKMMLELERRGLVEPSLKYQKKMQKVREREKAAG